jgi:hypothetical protein
MSRQSLTLPLLGVGVLIMAVLLSWWGLSQVNRGSVGDGIGVVAFTVGVPSTTVSASPTSLAALPTGTPIPPGERALKLPTAAPGSPCPVSNGSREAVPEAEYIFGSEGYWFGSGPVYLSLGWHDRRTPQAMFSLDGVSFEEGYYQAKSPWVARPDYVGRIRVRGRQIDHPDAKTVLFSEGGSRADEDLGFYSYGGRGTSRWAFWPASLHVPGPGCYALQIDTEDLTDFIVFETTQSTPASSPDATP